MNKISGKKAVTLVLVSRESIIAAEYPSVTLRKVESHEQKQKYGDATEKRQTRCASGRRVSACK